jgi:hypothetical protein
LGFLLYYIWDIVVIVYNPAAFTASVRRYLAASVGLVLGWF